MKQKQTVESILGYAESKTDTDKKIIDLALALPIDELNDNKRKFVAVMLLPESINWTNRQKALSIGINEATFYGYLKDDLRPLQGCRF